MKSAASDVQPSSGNSSPLDLDAQGVNYGRVNFGRKASRWAGPGAIATATALMALQDTIVALLSGDIPLWQLFFLRSAMVIPVLTCLIARRDPHLLRQAVAPWPLLRSSLLVAMYVFFYAGLPVAPLSIVAAVYYTGPIFIVLLSALLLRERLALSQCIAVVVAFLGVLIVLRPESGDLSPATLIPLASALCYALAAVTTRGRMSVSDPWVLTLSLNLVFAGVGGAGMLGLVLVDPPNDYPFLLSPWSPLNAGTIGTLAVLAAISIGIHVFLARAYQWGPTSVVAGLDYAYLVFAALWAFLILGTAPSLQTAAGTALIAAAGLWGMFRQGRP